MPPRVVANPRTASQGNQGMRPCRKVPAQVICSRPHFNWILMSPIKEWTMDSKPVITDNLVKGYFLLHSIPGSRLYALVPHGWLYQSTIKDASYIFLTAIAPKTWSVTYHIMIHHMPMFIFYFYQNYHGNEIWGLLFSFKVLFDLDFSFRARAKL